MNDPSPGNPESEPPPPGLIPPQAGPDGRCYWPSARRTPEEGEAIEAACTECGQVWVSHQDMAGYRLRCHCDAWVDLPPPAQAVALIEDVHEPAAPPALVGDRGLVSIPELKSGEVYEGRIPTSVAMAPGSLRHTTVENQQRWTNRSLLEIGAMMAAFYAPALAISLFLEGEQFALAMPLADLVTGVLVLAIGFTAGMYTFGGLRPARLLRFAEGAAVGLAGAGLAVLWSTWLQGQMEAEDEFLAPLIDTLGVAGALFVVGFCPAVFEELAFRGLLQGRLTALYGDRLGVLVTGTAFALAHGVTAGFPFHLLGGVYLCSLRRRSNSLYPCMLTHFLYNSTIVLATG